MKANMVRYGVWLALGVLLGLGARSLFWSADRVALRSTGHGSGRSGLGLARSDEGSLLYARLPELASIKLDRVSEELRVPSRSKSPVRSRAGLNRLLVELAEDPSKAAELVERVQENAAGSNGNRRFLSEIYKVWAAHDPRAAMDSVEGLKNYQLQYSAFRSAIKIWAKNDPVAALDYVKNSSLDRVSQDGPEVILATLADSDPQRAVTLARQLGDQELERTLERTLIVKQAETEMARVWMDLGKIEDGEWQRQLRHAAIDALARKDRPQAITYAEQFEEPKQREFAIRNVFRNWPLSNAEEAKAAFLDYQKNPLPDGLAFEFGQIMNLAGGDEALAYASSLEGQVRDDFLRGVLTEQAIKKPAETAAIAEQYIDNEKDLIRVYDHLGSSWAGKDEHAAAEWLANLPDSRARDEAVSSFSKKLFTMDPERALQWAASINDTQERQDRTEKLIREWRNTDATAADAWLGENGASLGLEEGDE